MDKLKIEFLQQLQSNNDFDNSDHALGAFYLNNYRDISDKIFDTKNVEYIICIMQTMKDWFEGIDDIGDRLIDFAKKNDSKAFLAFFLKNIEVMYPHAIRSIRYIFIHFLQMKIFKPYVYENFVKLSSEQKKIFKEIYLLVLEEDREYFSIPEIDEALKSIT
jgi:hypothetical protein